VEEEEQDRQQELKEKEEEDTRATWDARGLEQSQSGDCAIYK